MRTRVGLCVYRPIPEWDCRVQMVSCLDRNQCAQLSGARAACESTRNWQNLEHLEIVGSLYCLGFDMMKYLPIGIASGIISCTFFISGCITCMLVNTCAHSFIQ